MKRALVTGGAIRLGAAICARLAEAGYSLVLHHGRSVAAAETLAATLRQAHGVEVSLVSADLSDAAQVLRLAAAASEGLDLLVNSAAMFSATRTLSESVAAWDQFMAVNLKAPMLLSIGCAEALKARRGAIVNIADVYAARPLKGYLPYSVAKAGVVALTRSLAVELAPEVRVNAIAPGNMLPPSDRPVDPAAEQRKADAAPLKRGGSPSDIADAVLFLATAPFITGQILAVDGGRSLTW